MDRAEFYKLSKEIKTQIAEIIIQFNFIESAIKQILCLYIDSPKVDFVNEIILHNSIVSLGSKISILEFILDKEKVSFLIKQDLYRLLKIRNAVAHSDNLLNMQGDIIGYETIDYEFDIKTPIFEPYLHGPKIIEFNSGQIKTNGFNEYYIEFNNKLITVKNGLEQIKVAIIKLSCLPN